MHVLLYTIAILATAGVILRPFRLPEALFAVAGAFALLASGQITPGAAWEGVAKGEDVYFFLTGMMLLAETAREEKVFDWLAAHATRYAKGSPQKLFLLVYSVGIIVTTFLSNDATAVVLTPAVAAATRAARIKDPLPYLFICAFIANAASFVLPISNPANLVIYGSHMPPLGHWLLLYLAPSVVSIVVTLGVLYISQKKKLRQPMLADVPAPGLSAGGKLTIGGVVATVLLLLIFSALDKPLGLPTAAAGIFTAALVLMKGRCAPLKLIKQISWSVLPLVAGLFVIVEALDRAGVISTLGRYLESGVRSSVPLTAWGSGIGIALLSNLVNNLPSGLISAGAIQTAHLPELVKGSILVGVDLGPNLSVTGSLATILWLTALRRENITVSAGKFLRLGIVVMLSALLLTLLTLTLCIHL